MVKKLFCIFSCFLIIFSSTLTAHAYTPSNFTVAAEGVVFANFDTETIIYEKNADKRLYPASLTKILTAAVVLDECADPKNTKVTVTEGALLPLLGTGSSVFNLVEGEELSALDLLYITLVHSANDAANALALHFGNGNISNFITKMNQKATDIGMANSHFVNAHGLHNENHYTTPRDMYILTKYMLKNPLFKEIVGTVRYTVPENNKNKARTAVSTIYLQDPNSPIKDYYYPYASGVKTGYTDEAGKCLISTATKGGTTYICVLMKSPVYTAAGTGSGLHFTDSKALYMWAFDTFEYREVYNSSTPVGECPVELGKDADHVPVVLEKPVNAILPKDADNSTIKIELDFSTSPATAPIKSGQVLGYATVKYGGEELATVKAVAMTDVEKSSLLAFVKFFTDLFSSNAFITIIVIIVLLIFIFILYCAWLNRRRKKRRRRPRRF